MEINIAKSAGYCFGVSRAMEKVNNEPRNGKLYTYGAIIHNKEALKELEASGVYAIENLDCIDEGTIFIRTHGVPPEIYDSLKEKSLNFIDCTCPYVKRIHNIVEKAYTDNKDIIILGDKNHPEVKGIIGWAGGNAIIINSLSDAYAIDKINGNVCIVAQTTFISEHFIKITDVLRKKIKNYEVNNTICQATEIRQEEAKTLAGSSTKVIIVGDKSSANTQKLYSICKETCFNSYLIETICDLQLNIFTSNDKIGITAGASTPPAILKEVVSFMSDFEKNTVEGDFEPKENQTFEEMLNESFVSLHTGDIVKGTVISVSNEEVSVNLGYKSDGIIPRGEFSSDSNIVVSDVVKSGDEIEVYVSRVNDGDGNVLLSKKRLEAHKGIEEIEKAFESGEVLTGKVLNIVRGGLIAVYKNIRVFIPSSQVSYRYVENLDSFKNTEINFKIIEYDRSKRRIVGGRKEIALEELNQKREKAFESIEIGQKIEGAVSRIVNFGAFVDIGGIDGLIHISEMSWGMTKHPSEVLSEGQKVTVIVIDVNKEKGKISLSLKDVSNDPWNDVQNKYPVDSIVTGKVVRMVDFGAFVELEQGVDGLVHISQISKKHVAKPEDELSIGEMVKFKVLDINVEQKKISLSKKEADTDEFEGDVNPDQPDDDTNLVIEGETNKSDSVQQEEVTVVEESTVEESNEDSIE